MPNPFVHVELATTDLPKARAFYGALFDWQFEEFDTGTIPYTLIKVGERGPGCPTGGGMMAHPVPGAPSWWLPYVYVEDVRAAAEKACALGATLCKEVTEVPNAGWFAILTDPTGAMLGLWQPKAM